MKVLASAGDIGGLRALVPVLKKLNSEKVNLSVIDHGHLLKELPEGIPYISEEESKDLPSSIIKNELKVFIFSTSVKDKFSLELARNLKEKGVFILCLLDNWMNYRSRLEIDGKDMFIPDYYLMMDEIAKSEAEKDGIPSGNLLISGQPALAEIAKNMSSRDRLKKEFNAQFPESSGKSIIAFVSEPAEKDQGKDDTHPGFRGYTEKIVLTRLLKEMQSLPDDYYLVILPHPRDNISELEKLWRENKGNISGEFLKGFKSNEVINIADGVAGMASILLFEAWLQDKSVISLQPGLLKGDLRTLEKRNGVIFLSKESEWSDLLSVWFKNIQNQSHKTKGYGVVELERHKAAVRNICELIKSKL